MAGFLYFLPGERVYQKSMLVTYGLTHIVDVGGRVHSQQVIRGPENQPGVVLGASASWTDSDVKWSDELRWKPFPKPHAEKQALCCWRGDLAMPGPADLARAQQLPGQFLTLADGREWLIPHARRWFDDTAYSSVIPKLVGVDVETGEYVAKDVLVQYRELNQHAEAYFAAYMAAAVQAGISGQASIEVSDPVGFMFATIGANYRVSATEIDVLTLVDEMAFDGFATIVMDRKSTEPIQKKTESDTTSI